jgi:hypothetical protein
MITICLLAAISGVSLTPIQGKTGPVEAKADQLRTLPIISSVITCR